ncbi:MAG: response regulator [Candidatus Omnitrophica bacterium]|nr:response regulator [Candidatus Omnitrophota bacterium]
MKNKILIIDDDSDFVEAISLILSANGYEPIKALSGEEGFNKAKHESPDLILLDMIMAYKDEGAEIARALSQDISLKNTPVILVTGLRKDEGLDPKSKMGELPVKAIIDKPVDPEVLLKNIRTYMQSSGDEHRKMVDEVTKIANRWKDKEGNLVMILHDIQGHYGFVPRQISFELSRLLDVPLARIYEVITFYNYFKLKAPGKYIISVCMGTACYLKGAPQILRELRSLLGVEEGGTSKDGLFHLQVVRCLGCCGLAPVIMINGKVHGKLTKESVKEIIDQYASKEKQENG